MAFSKGFSTIELMIAMAVFALMLSAVALTAYGAQSFLTDAPASAQARAYAQRLLDREEALANEDFELVNPATSSQTVGALTFSAQLSVTQPNALSKSITAAVSWPGGYGRTRTLSLSTVLTDYADANTMNACDSSLSGNWSAPQIKNSMTNFAQLANDATTTYLVSDAVASNGKLYVTQNNSALNKETFFIFDVSNPSQPTLLSKLDNDPKHQSGLTAVAIASSSAGLYAYVASASSFASGQLQVINISNPRAPFLVTTFKVPTSTAPVAGLGKSIFYARGYIYLGLAKSAGGEEFNIINVSDPAHPSWVGGYAVGNDVNALYVKGTYAYIASPNSKNLIVLDISNPANPTLAGSYIPGGGSNGESLEMLGQTVYLGRTFGTNEFYVLNVDAGSVTPLGSIDIGSGSGTSVQGLVVRDYLAFLLTNAQLQMVRIDAPAALAKYGTGVSLPSGSSGTGVALACDGDYLYALSSTATSSYLSAIHP